MLIAIAPQAFNSLIFSPSDAVLKIVTIQQARV